MLYDFPPTQLRKDGRGNICIKCVLAPKKTSSYGTNAHRTSVIEKRKAFDRDKKCIIPGCCVSSYYELDFHHAYAKAKDKFYDKNVNDYRRGVMLCRHHHRLVKYNIELYEHCQNYLERLHGDYLYPIIALRNERNQITTAV